MTDQKYIDECNEYFENLKKNISKSKTNKAACVRTRKDCMNIINVMKNIRNEVLECKKSIPSKKKDK